MTFLPIIERELRVRSRRGVTYWTRFAVALFGVLVCLMQLSIGSAIGGVPAAGNAAFQALVVVAFCLCCGACLLTADAISAERREGTLGLLFLTRVRGHDVLLGKLASAALAGFCAVLAFLPVLMIPVLSGGVTGGEAFRKGLALLDALFVGLAAGLWASARADEWQTTTRKAVLLMLGILILPLIYGFLTRDFPPWARTAAAFSPITALSSASDLSYRTDPGRYWTSLVLMHLAGWALVWRAGALLRQSLRESPSLAAVPDHSPALPTAPPIRRRRRKLLTDQTGPLHWLMARQRGLWLAVWAGVLIVVGQRFLYPMLFLLVSPGAATPFMLWPVSLILHTGQAALFAWAASRFFVKARRSGELELLGTTPEGADRLVSAQWMWLKRLFAGPVAVLVLVNLLQAAPILWQSYTRVAYRAWGSHYAVSVGVGCVSLCAEILALCWMGMWFGLKARSQTAAITWTVGVVSVAPALLTWCVVLVAATLGPVLGISRSSVNYYFSWTSQIVAVLFYIWLMHGARRALAHGSRDGELLPVGFVLGGIRGWWRSLLTAIGKARHWTPS